MRNDTNVWLVTVHAFRYHILSVTAIGAIIEAKKLFKEQTRDSHNSVLQWKTEEEYEKLFDNNLGGVAHEINIDSIAPSEYIH